MGHYIVDTHLHRRYIKQLKIRNNLHLLQYDDDQCVIDPGNGMRQCEDNYRQAW